MLPCLLDIGKTSSTPRCLCRKLTPRLVTILTTKPQWMPKLPWNWKPPKSPLRHRQFPLPSDFVNFVNADARYVRDLELIAQATEQREW